MVKLARFFGLVKNEYIKILKRTSTKIMIVLIVLAAIGLTSIYRIQKELIEDNSYYYYDDTAVDYTESMEWLEQTQPDGWENTYALYEYLQSLNLDYVKDTDLLIAVSYVESIDGMTADEAGEILSPWVDNDDWKSTLKALIPYAESDAQAWELNYRIDNDICFSGEDSVDENEWKDDLLYEVTQAKESLEMDLSDSERESYENIVTLGLYRLDNDISVNPADEIGSEALYDGINIWTALFNLSDLSLIVGLLVMIIAGGCVANEYSQGTIKFLLMNPVKRGKILMSKYFSVITLGYILLIITFIICLPTAGILLGFDGLGDPYLTVESGKVVESSAMLKVIETWLLSSIEIVIYATFAMAVSSLLKSSVLAVGASVFMMSAGSTAVAILSALGMDWARYLVFANLDLATISAGNSSFPMHTLSFAIMVLVAHMAVFLLTMWDAFTKKEV